MHGILANLTSRVRRRRRLIGFAAVVLLIFGWVNLRAMLMRQPAHAKQSVKTVRDRAAEVCSALGNTCELNPEPIFSERLTECYRGDKTPLRLWKFMCQIDGRPTWLIFNDDTAGMCYLISERAQSKGAAKRGPVALKTRAEAAEVGFQRLKAMKVLPPGTLVALHAVPQMNPSRSLWEIIWVVKRDASSRQYAIRMLLDRVSGAPLSMVDMSHLAKPHGS